MLKKLTIKEYYKTIKDFDTFLNNAKIQINIKDFSVCDALSILDKSIDFDNIIKVNAMLDFNAYRKIDNTYSEIMELMRYKLNM